MLIHEGHPGVVRSKALARSIVWWPSLNDDIVNLCKNCTPCTVVNLRKTKQYVSWPKCSHPFQRVHLDFFEWKSLSYFIMCDAFSHWIHVKQMNSTATVPVINELMSIISIFGLPTIIVADNGPPFDADDFARVLTSLNVQLLHSPIYNPESNGLAEKGVDVAKKALNKLFSQADLQTVSDNELLEIVQFRLSKFLFNYRNTPSSVDGKTPNELLLSYKPATMLNQLLPSGPGSSAGTRSHFRAGETVYFKLTKRSPAVMGVITSALGPNRYCFSVQGVIKELHHNQLCRATTL